MISRKSSALIFGGYCDGNSSTGSSSTVARYTRGPYSINGNVLDQWERLGRLQNSRFAHRAIANGDRIFVVGGQGT